MGKMVMIGSVSAWRMKAAESLMFRCLLPLFLLAGLAGCNGTRGGVLNQLPEPALRSGMPGARVVEAPKRAVVIPEEPVVAPSPRRSSGLTVVLDPGHGGQDSGTPGCASTQYVEKVVNLAIGREVRRQLESRGISVIMTRSDDRFLALDERPAIANRAGADLFVSIHADASPNHSRTGATVYISRSPCQGSRDAAGAIRDGLVSGGFKCNGIKQADYRVLTKNQRACLLVECGFLTNPGESGNLCDPGYQARMAATLAEAIASYLGQ
jgi:N-acetylmuramoyl-L-alanine amidase